MKDSDLLDLYTRSNHVKDYLGTDKDKEAEDQKKDLIIRNSFNSLYRSEQQSIKFLKNKFNTVLDIGCGTGSISQVLENFCADKKMFRYLGVIFDERMIHSAQKFFGSKKITFEKKDAFNSEQTNSSTYSLATAFNLITQYKDWKNALKKSD